MGLAISAGVFENWGFQNLSVKGSGQVAQSALLATTGPEDGLNRPFDTSPTRGDLPYRTAGVQRGFLTAVTEYSAQRAENGDWTGKDSCTSETYSPAGGSLSSTCATIYYGPLGPRGCGTISVSTWPPFGTCRSCKTEGTSSGFERTEYTTECPRPYSTSSEVDGQYSA